MNSRDRAAFPRSVLLGATSAGQRARAALRTTAARAALRNAGLTFVFGTLALGAVYLGVAQYVDAQLRAGLEQELARLQERFTRQGRAGLVRALDVYDSASARDGRYAILIGQNGRRLAGNLAGWPLEDAIPLDAKVHTAWIEDDAVVGARLDDDAFWPVAGLQLTDGSRLLLAGSVARSEQVQTLVLSASAGLLAAIVLIALVTGLITGREILARIESITEAATEIMAGDLGRRMPATGPGDELDALVERVNLMLDRIQRLVTGMRNVTDDVAHDLRSPLTRLRNRLDVALHRERSPEEYRAALEGAVEEVEGMMQTFDALLQIAQLEAGQQRLPFEEVDLAELARDVGDLFGPLAEDRGLRFEMLLADRATTRAVPALVAQVLGNLLDNAIKFTPAGGVVRLRVTAKDDCVTAAVEDSGAGIPRDERARVFERFVRLDTARNTPGNGLGLALVKAVAELHQATVDVEDLAPGTRIAIRFPREGSALAWPAASAG